MIVRRLFITTRRPHAKWGYLLVLQIDLTSNLPNGPSAQAGIRKLPPGRNPKSRAHRAHNREYLKQSVQPFLRFVLFIVLTSRRLFADAYKTSNAPLSAKAWIPFRNEPMYTLIRINPLVEASAYSVSHLDARLNIICTSYENCCTK